MDGGQRLSLEFTSDPHFHMLFYLTPAWLPSQLCDAKSAVSMQEPATALLYRSDAILRPGHRKGSEPTRSPFCW